MFFKREKKCTTCSETITFEYAIIDTAAGTKLNKSVTTLYCKCHFFETLKQHISTYVFPFIFHEPHTITKHSQLFFYSPETLEQHGFLSADVVALKELFARARYIYLDREALENPLKVPLVKVAEPQLQIEATAHFLIRLEKYVGDIELKYSKGSFWSCLPYAESGVFIYHDYQ